MPQPTRYLTPADRLKQNPVHVVWEITLACDLKCHHCGSRAGKRRPTELSTEECLDVVRQLAALGAREVTLIGGEAYLRPDWTKIIREVRRNGMDCTAQSGGLNLTEKRVAEAAEAGLQAMGISLDGLPELHNRLRGVPRSFEAAIDALERLRRHGITTSVNTQITTLVIPELRDLFQLILKTGARNWQVQLTVAMGRAADNPDILLQPYELLELMPLLAELYREGVEHGLLLQPGNNIGYFGPYESVWRGSGDDRIYWGGCNAGKNTMGIEADGTIKGCPSLATSAFAGGNVRDLKIEQIWEGTEELNFNQSVARDDLWGYCRSCYYADSCHGGCTWTAHSLFGRAGNNPYCHHRALELKKMGLRERVMQVARAPGESFDHGYFDLVLEKRVGDEWRRADGDSVVSAGSLVQIKPRRRLSPPKAHTEQRKSSLVLCRACSRHVRRGTHVCPHCGADVRAAASKYRSDLRVAEEACRDLLDLIDV
jgi:Y-X(10)_GDL-associated radical SAM protein